VDPELVPEAKMLRSFFPDDPNRAYMRLVEVDAATGEESPVLVATNKLAAAEIGVDVSRAATMGVADASQGAKRREYRDIEGALRRLSCQLAGASRRGDRFDGVAAFSQGANLVVLALALLDAAESAAADAERDAAALPPGPAKVAAKAAARVQADSAAARARVLRPPMAILFCISDFGWTSQLMSSPPLAARCLAALDAGVADASPSGLSAEPSAEPSADAGAAGAATEAEVARAPAAALEGVFSAPIAKPKVLVVLGKQDVFLDAGRLLASRFAPGACTILEHSEGHKIPSMREASVCQRVLNFAKRGSADEMVAGAMAWYEHRRLGWLHVRLTKVDYEGVHDGGATYCITHAELDGEVETVRTRLHLARPDGDAGSAPSATAGGKAEDVA
jgi:hypothetical protein